MFPNEKQNGGRSRSEERWREAERTRERENISEIYFFEKYLFFYFKKVKENIRFYRKIVYTIIIIITYP